MCTINVHSSIFEDFAHLVAHFTDLVSATYKFPRAASGLSLTLPTVISHSTTEPNREPHTVHPNRFANLHVHIASVFLVVQLICSWCFCTCRSLMSGRVGCEQILRCSGQAGEIRQGESPLHPRRHDRLRIFCSTLATNRKRPSDHDENSSSHHDRSRGAFVKAGSRTSLSCDDRETSRSEINSLPWEVPR